ncbi:MAG TPA: hypothetical protein VGI86_02325 [Acidimicrobiia bacterium]
MSLFHVTSVHNRESIQTFGLDWTRMAAARGIAGSRRPEQDGCFLCRSEFEMEWIVGLNNTGGPVDVWAVDGVDVVELVESPEGFLYLPGCIAVEQLQLWRTDCPPR